MKIIEIAVALIATLIDVVCELIDKIKTNK